MGVIPKLCFLIVGALGLAPCTKAFCHGKLHITGGRKVSLKDTPFMASIHEVDLYHGEYAKVCAGSVIHERYILTAASCTAGNQTKERQVRVATDAAFISVERELCHKDFDTEALTNDICLLKLKSGVPFATVIKVTLPGRDSVLEVGALVNATGWGATRHGGDMEKELRQVTIPVLPQKCCNEIYDEFNVDQICAGARHRDFCEGDMGGPLTHNGVQFGVISGDGECGKNPGIYTRVTSYLDWILDGWTPSMKIFNLYLQSSFN